jgi:ComF family protein
MEQPIRHWHGALAGIAVEAVRWFLPPVCMACHVPLAPGGHDFLCTACLRDLQRITPPPCLRCDPWSSTAGEAPCEDCAKLPESFTSRRAAFPYRGVAGDLVRNLKYRRRLHVAGALARLMAGALGDHLDRLRAREADLLVPVPMHAWRAWRRGGNHAEHLARELAALTGARVEPHLLVRTRATPPQARRSGVEARLANVAGAFAVPEPDRLRGRRVVLLDDVMTTGATGAEAAGALLEAGAEEVHLVTACQAGAPAAQLVAVAPELAAARPRWR